MDIYNQVTSLSFPTLICVVEVRRNNMGGKKRICDEGEGVWLGSSGVVLIMMILVVQCSTSIGSVSAAAQVPAMFIFGDSLIDVGNNNYLSSLAKSNYYPYGCDFRAGPTGRFSNGRTVVDMLGWYLQATATPYTHV